MIAKLLALWAHTLDRMVDGVVSYYREIRNFLDIDYVKMDFTSSTELSDE
jgi:hypothetical protein